MSESKLARNMEPIFGEVPSSGENPLLAASSSFHKYCRERIRGLTSWPRQFSDWTLEAAKHELLRPAYIHGETRYYASYQVWQVYHLNRFEKLDAERPKDFDQFEVLLKLFAQIQDYYLPQVRSDQRVGHCKDYHGWSAIGGTYFCNTTDHEVKGWADQRKKLITSSRFLPSQMLANSSLSAADLRNWICRFMGLAQQIDPLSNWYLLIRYVSYSKRQELKYESRFAQDLLEMAEMLRLFHADASDEPIFADILVCREKNDKSAVGDTWLEKRYGSSLSHPFEMLEYVANEYGLNPKPRAIVFTEGAEWMALSLLYQVVGAAPEYTGIEFRSLDGNGNFSIANWQCFIEYMHEKQVIIYFVVDREGRAEKEARRLLDRKRLFKFDGLEKVIPSEDRLCVWDTSFEEANFTDDEIAQALRLQGVSISPNDVALAHGATKGLISAVAEKLNVKIDKMKLSQDLVASFIEWRDANPDAPERAVEAFVRKSAQLIVLNHLPSDPESRSENLKSGLLG